MTNKPQTKQAKADVFDETEAKEKKTTRKATKPAWRPASKLATLKAKDGFTARWVSADPTEIARKKAEGWVIMKPRDNIGPAIDQIDVNDGKALHDGIRYRDMIAMMLPDDMKKAREEYHEEENRQAMAGILKETDGQLNKMGAQTFAPKGAPGRIVIE